MFNFKFLSKMTKMNFSLRNVVAIVVACLVVTTMFASCKETNDDDDNNGKGRELTAKEKELVGVWVPRPEYVIDYAGGIEFKADGTFFCIIKNNSGAVRGEITQKGNFKIQGDKIICTKVLESWKQQGGNQSGNYTDKAIADLTWKFYFSTTAENDIIEGLYPNLKWLAINILPADPDDIDWFTKSTVK